MEKDFILKDTDQIKKMKEICINSRAYSCVGEIYKLLSYDTLHKLVRKIPKKNIELKSTLKYGKKVITADEKFLENLDLYIGYVKDHYFIQHSELTILIELTLKNKYNDILFAMDDFHEKDNYKKYHDAFRKMFLFNFYDNVCFYSQFVDKFDDINLFLDEIKDYDFDDSEDIILIENILIKVFNNRNNNLYNSFMPNNEIEKEHYSFYIHQVNWVLSDYYEEGSYSFVLNNNDHYIELYNNNRLLFNIVKKKKLSNEVIIRFGIINKNFCADKIISFSKKEFQDILKRLKKYDVSKKYDIEYDFVDSSLIFNFWNSEGIQFLDIYFQYSNNGDKYMISMDPEDTKNLYKLIKEQL